jgi:regulator of sigma E protease
VEDSAAEAAGLLPGDRILKVDDEAVTTFDELRQIIGQNRGTPVQLLIERDGRQLSLAATPRLVETEVEPGSPTTTAQLGITQSSAPLEPLDPLSAVARGVEETYDLSLLTIEAVAQIISGSRGTEDLSGPIQIANMSGEVADLGFGALVNFMAILSISLGLINLVPIPVLDGGHLLFYAIEWVRGRPLSRRAIEVAMSFGLVAILGLFVTTTVLDLMKFDGIVAFFSGLTG